MVSRLGIQHTHYSIDSLPSRYPELAGLDLSLLLKVAFAAVFYGLVGVLFAELTHGLSHLFKAISPSPVVRPMIGGVLLIGMVGLVGSTDYLGLGGPRAGRDKSSHV